MKKMLIIIFGVYILSTSLLFELPVIRNKKNSSHEAINTIHTSVDSIGVSEILFELIAHAWIIPGYAIKPFSYFLNIYLW